MVFLIDKFLVSGYYNVRKLLYFTIMSKQEIQEAIKNYQQKIEGLNDINLSKAQVLQLITMFHWDDLEFIEKVNDLTYSRKVQLKARLNK